MELPPATIQAVHEALLAGNKIEAIKLVREATGKDLKDSKDFIDRLEAELRKTHPEQFKASGKGCLLLALLPGLPAAAFIWAAL